MMLISIRNKCVLDFEGNAVDSQESYERQKARQRQMRHDRGLKPLGRPQGLRDMPLQDATASCGGRPIKNSNETMLEKLD